VIAQEFQDPWGKVNAYFGLVLFGLLGIATINYVAGDLDWNVDLGFTTFQIGSSGIGDLLLVFGFLTGSLIYWFLCLGTFIQTSAHRSKDSKDD